LNLNQSWKPTQKSWKGSCFFYILMDNYISRPKIGAKKFRKQPIRNKYFKWRVISYLFKIKFGDVNTMFIGKGEFVTIWCITSFTVAAFNLDTKIDFLGTMTVSGTGEERAGLWMFFLGTMLVSGTGEGARVLARGRTRCGRAPEVATVGKRLVGLNYSGETRVPESGSDCPWGHSLMTRSHWDRPRRTTHSLQWGWE